MKSTSKDKKKSIKTKMLYLPIVMIIVVVTILLVSVTLSTGSSMKSALEESSEILVESVAYGLGEEESGDINVEIYQGLVDDLQSKEGVNYAGYLDAEGTYLVNSDKSYIGMGIKSREGVSEAYASKNTVISDVYDEEEDVVEVVYPIVKEGKVVGSVIAGFNMEGLKSGMFRNLMIISVIGLLGLALITGVLYYVTRDILLIVNALGEDSRLMAVGDFTMETPDEVLNREDELGEIARFNRDMKGSIKEILLDVSGKAGLVSAHSQEMASVTNQSEMSAEELSMVIQEIAGATSSQAHEVEDGLIVVRGLTDATKVNTENMERLNLSTEEVNTLKDEGIQHIKDLVENTRVTRESILEIGNVIGDTNESAGNIARAVDMIESISQQTNLLALNASIEAARAGEHGRGFAVVAEEIRSLAEDSRRFTEEIEVIVRDLMTKTDTAVNTMEDVNKVVELQGQSVELTDGKFQGISDTLEGIQKVIDVVNNSNDVMIEYEDQMSNLMENLAAVAEENAAGTEEASASVEQQNEITAEITKASQDLAGIAEELNEAVQVFKI